MRREQKNLPFNDKIDVIALLMMIVMVMTLKSFGGSRDRSVANFQLTQLMEDPIITIHVYRHRVSFVDFLYVHT